MMTNEETPKELTPNENPLPDSGLNIMTIQEYYTFIGEYIHIS